jgi:hypothetical protein
MARTNRIHSIAKCSMCNRESYVRMVYCVPLSQSHFVFCRECADGLIEPKRAMGRAARLLWVLRDLSTADAREAVEST